MGRRTRRSGEEERRDGEGERRMERLREVMGRRERGRRGMEMGR